MSMFPSPTLATMNALTPNMQAPRTYEEAQKLATSRALSTAKEILLTGGTQDEVEEGAKAVAKQILRDFQLAKQAHVGLHMAEADVGMVRMK